MRDNQRTVKIELLSQWKLEAEFRNMYPNLVVCREIVLYSDILLGVKCDRKGHICGI